LSNDYASEAGRWYDKDAKSRNEVPNKSKPGTMRPTRKSDAKKNGWVPSVSGICRLAPAEQLLVWLIKRGIKTTLDLPILEGEDIDDYCWRVYSDTQRQGREIMDLGSTIHGCIEKRLRGETYDQAYRDHTMGALDALSKWCGMDGLCPERSFYHSLGFGGKCDIHKKLDPFPGFVADFKTKDFGEDEYPQAYSRHAMQLSAYREGFGMPKARCAIIYVSTKTPGLTRLVEVTQEELAKGWRMFCLLLEYWQIENGF
jgi:hypothetical protein